VNFGSEDRKAIVDAIKEGFRQANRGGNQDRSGPRTDRTVEQREADRKRAKEAEEKGASFTDSIAKKLGGTLTGDLKKMINTEIREGITLDQTDFNVLFDPLARVIDQFRSKREADQVSLRAFGDTLANVGVSGNDLAAGLQNAMARSEELYGSSRAGKRVFMDLAQSFGGFIGLTKDGRDELVQTALAMDKLGFDTNDVSKVMDNATRSMGMSSDEAMKTTANLANLRKEFNVSASEISKNFIFAQENLLYSTDRVNTIFTQLQRTSRITGVDFNKLATTFGDTMDSFEGSAQKAGGLNALLGGNIFNSLELLEMDEAERMNTMIEGIRSNVNVTSLVSDKFNLKAVAKQLGLSPAETRRVLLGETGVAAALDKALPDSKTVMEKQHANLATSINDLNEIFKKGSGRINQELLVMANNISDSTGVLVNTNLLRSAEAIEKILTPAKADANFLAVTAELNTRKEQEAANRKRRAQPVDPAKPMGDQLTIQPSDSKVVTGATVAAKAGVLDPETLAAVGLLTAAVSKLENTISTKTSAPGGLKVGKLELDF